MARRDRTVRDAFEDVAARLPDRPAIVGPQGEISYSGLDRWAARFHRALIEAGIRPGERVAVLAGREPLFAAAALGIWKAGAAYLPISPADPPGRVREVLAGAGVRLAIAGSPGELPDGIVRVEASPTPWEAPSASLDPGAAAYVIFTSGTTGSPKGVLIGHGSLWAMVESYSDRFGVRESARTSFVSDTGFDAAMVELWPALSHGLAVHIPSDDVRASPGLLRDWLAGSGIDYCWLPTPLMEMYFRQDWTGWTGGGPRLFLTAGEALNGRPPPNFPAEVHNAYGPTEATVIATSGPVAPEGEEAPGIGTSLSFARTYVLDPDLRPVRPGEKGELYIGGLGVGIGYLGDPELTAKRFLRDPFSPEPDARMYATGDLCEERDGELHFRGRIDRQVKLRGNRVELGEVEARLRRLPGVADAAVAVVGRGVGARLAAALVPSSPGFEAGEAQLNEALSRHLARYMLPARYLVLDGLPLKASGKIDRARLESLLQDDSGPEPETPDEPMSEREAAVAAAMAEVIGRRIGLDANFFAAGGNSLAAMLLLEKLGRTTGVRIAFSALFREPTARAVARRLEAGSAARTITPRSEAERSRCPLSASQRAILFLATLQPESKAYHAKSLLHLHGALDVEALRDALGDVVARHEIYRTTFHDEGAGPVQLIHPPFRPELPVLDLAAAADGDVEAALDSLHRGELNDRFDLERLPLVRWALARLAPDRHVLFHVEHHLVHDGWSYTVFLDDLLAFYAERRSGIPLPAAGPQLQQGDFACFERDWLASPDAAAKRAYWTARLADLPLPAEIPTDRPRRPGRRSGDSVRRRLARDRWTPLERLATEGFTPFMVALAALAAVLHRYTGQSDLCIGSAFSNRGATGAERIIGLVLNTVALRLRVDPDAVASTLLREAREAVVGAQDNQELPLESLVEALNPPRDENGTPFFRVFFGFHDSPMPPLRAPGLDRIVAVEALDSRDPKFDLSIVVIPRPGQAGAGDPVHCVWEYRSDLYDSETIEGIAEAFECALRRLGSGEDLPVAQLLQPAGRDPPAGLEGPVRPWPDARPVALQILERAEAAPEAVAARSATGSLTYRELVDRTARCAAALRERGVGPGDRVGVSVARDLLLLPLLLAIHVRGAAYVPIDSDLPDIRRHFLLDDSRVGHLVHDAGERPEAPPPIRLHALDELMGRAPDRLEPGTLDESSAAYVIYTSGSTGRPKGVEVGQRALTNLVRAMAEALGAGCGDALLSVTPLSFDIGALELFLPLLTGGTVVFAGAETVRDPRAVIEAIDRQAITIIQATPTFWRVVMAERPNFRPGLRLLCGGEPMTRELAAAFLGCGASVFNVYGPTETTIWSTLSRLDERHADRVTVGGPIANTRIYIVDRALQPLPRGAVGQVAIAGDGLAEGYWDDERLTAERFVTAPFGDRPRLYLTGDLGRIDRNGELELAGRSDRQVKLRGYRIELDEIEQVLLEHPKVREAAAVIVAPAGGEPFLQAFVTGEIDDGAQARPWLAERLPSFMVPAAIEAIARMPLTSSGKVDRQALSRTAAPLVASIAEPAATATEARLFDLYQEVMGRRPGSRRSGFFALGGYSLAAARLASRISAAFGVQLGVGRFLRLDTLEATARWIDEETAGEKPPAVYEDIRL